MINFFVRLAGGLVVRYGSRKAAEAAAKNIGGKVIKNVTKEVKDKAVSYTKLKNNPTVVDKIKAQLGIRPKQSKSMPRPGVSDKPKGADVGKLAQTASHARTRNKTLATLIGGSALYNALTKEENGKVEADLIPKKKKTPSKIAKKKKPTSKIADKDLPKPRPKNKKKGVTFEFETIPKGKTGKKKLYTGGALKKTTPAQKGLRKLPTAVRNNMGYMHNGGSPSKGKKGVMVISIGVGKMKKKK